jgi:cellobiose phosphorylase
MIYKFIDDFGTFVVDNPQRYNLYFPLTNREGSILSSISPNLSGDIKKDSEHFLTPPASVEDLRSNLLCRREFFIKVGQETIRLSHAYNDTLEAGFLYQKITKKTSTLQIEIINFVPYDLAAEVMWVKVRNISKRELIITPTSFIPLFARAEKNLRDHRHVSSLLNRVSLNKYGIFVKPTMVFDERAHKVNQTIYYVQGVEGNTKAPLGQFPTLDYFYGESDLLNPDAIAKDIKPVNKHLPEFDGKEACAALRFRQKRLKKNQEADYILVMGLEDSAEKIKNIFSKLNTHLKAARSLKQTKKYWQDYLAQVGFDFKHKNFNNWLLWVMLQPNLRKLFGCSFLPHFDYGKGGRGWRDLWQDALTLLLTQPEKAKDFILDNFKGVRIDGSNATIITKQGGFISDRNRISRVWMDHGIWPYLTLRLYVNRTGDLNLLFKEVTYFRDQQLKRAKQIDSDFSQKDYLLRTKSKNIYKGSILEHLLVQNLVQFFNVGKHNLIRLENADWNDGLDMAADEGESVAFSFMYAHNLLDLCAILEKLKVKTDSVAILKELTFLLDSLTTPLDYLDRKAKQARLEEYFKKVKDISGEKVNINIDDLISDLLFKSESLFAWLRKHEWLEKPGLFNGYYDNDGKRVEGVSSPGGRMRMILTSQVFAIMSGGASETQVKKAWASITKYLKDKKLGGFRLNTDFQDLYLSLGRAFGFSYGDKENGAFFNHMVVMLANALYRRGFTAEGFQAINSIYQMSTSQKAQIYPMIPEYFNGEGKGLYYYLTGSASWYIYTLLQEILGIKFTCGDILLEPRLMGRNFFGQTIEARFKQHGKMIKVVFSRESKTDKLLKIKKVFLANQEIPSSKEGYIISKDDLEIISSKEVTLKVYLG